MSGNHQCFLLTKKELGLIFDPPAVRYARVARITRHSISTARSDPQSFEHGGIFSQVIDSLSPNFKLFSINGRTVWTNNIELSDFSNLFSPLVAPADTLPVRAIVQADGNKDFLNQFKFRS